MDVIPPIPQKITELGDLPLGVRDFIYLEKDGIPLLRYIGIMFIALSDMNLTSRIDAYISNISFPWSKKKEAQVTVGALIVYKVEKDAASGPWKFTRLWVKSYSVQTNIIYWAAELKLLSVGMDEGDIHCLRVAPDTGYVQHEDVSEC